MGSERRVTATVKWEEDRHKKRNVIQKFPSTFLLSRYFHINEELLKIPFVYHDISLEINTLTISKNVQAHSIQTLHHHQQNSRYYQNALTPISDSLVSTQNEIYIQVSRPYQLPAYSSAAVGAHWYPTTGVGSTAVTVAW